MKLFQATCWLLLVLSALTVKIEHEQGQEEFQAPGFLQILNSLLRLHELPKSTQLPNCFTAEEQMELNGLLQALIHTPAVAGTRELRQYPSYYRQQTQSVLSAETLACFYGARDFHLFIESFAVDWELMGNAFTKKVEDDFFGIHKSFVSLKEKYLKEDRQTVANEIDQLMLKMFGKRVESEDQWQKVAKHVDRYYAVPSQYFGITMANGMIGTVSSYKPLKTTTTVLAGLFDMYGPGNVEDIVELFPLFNMEMLFNGQNLNDFAKMYNYDQRFRFSTGELFGELSTAKYSLQYSYRALKNLPFAFLTSVDIVAHQTGAVTFNKLHSIPHYLNNVTKNFFSVQTDPPLNFMTTSAKTKTGAHKVVLCSTVSTPHDIKVFHEDQSSTSHIFRVRANVEKGKKYHFTFITALTSSVHHDDPQNEAIRILERASLVGETKLLQYHRGLWQQLWKNDIIIEGEPQDQKNVRLMLYHCYAFINEFKSYGIGPMGLSSSGYNGHVFWDMDIWVYPAVLALNQRLAKTLVQYRIDRMPAAENNAFINGYRGVMYPWESAVQGDEETPIYALTGPLEQHITGCVGIGAWNYFRVTQDLNWLREQGFPLIKKVAEFWESRVVKGEDGMYHIENVVGSDQYAENIDDDAFTNGVAKEILFAYNKAAKKLGVATNPAYDDIADKIIIHKLSNNVTSEHRTYNGQTIKQADVNLLAYPLTVITDKGQIKRDLDYYKAKIGRGTPAMTDGIFTILYSRLGQPEKAYDSFLESFSLNLKAPFGTFSETKGGKNPYFITGAGGVLQSVIYGFGGYEITDDGLKKIPSSIPKEWKKLTIKGFIQPAK